MRVLIERGENYKKYDNGDGSYTLESHINPTHYKNTKNEWEDIDCNIKNLKVEKTPFKVTFPEYFDGKRIIEYKGDIVTFEPEKEIKYHVKGIIKDNTITYILPEGVIIYTVTGTGVYEEVIVTNVLKARLIKFKENQIGNKIKIKPAPIYLLNKNPNNIIGLTNSSATCYTTAGDGYVTNHETSSTWDSTHDSTTGTTTDYTGDAFYLKNKRESDTEWIITRAFFPCDTSALPDDCIITAATFYAYAGAVYDEDNDGDDFITVVQTDQPSTTALTTADYNNCGATDNPTEGTDNRYDLSNGGNKWLSWLLNATGRSWINKTGITMLGLREGHDVLDHAITVGENTAVLRTSERAGTTYDPYLSVTYTLPFIPQIIVC